MQAVFCTNPGNLHDVECLCEMPHPCFMPLFFHIGLETALVCGLR